MIRTLTVKRAAILDCCEDDGKTAVEAASDDMAKGSVLALCQFSLLVSKQNHSDRSLTALDNALKRFHEKEGAL